MFAIDDATAVAVMPTPEAAGTPGFFTEGNPALGQAATYVRASFLNALIQEMLNILTAAGITPSKTTYDQLLSSFRSNALVTANDTGSANACAIAYTPAITTLTDGMVLWFKAAATNTGATTLAVNAVGAKNVVGGAHQPLQGGEIVAGGKCMVVWNAAIPAFVLVECTGAALQVAPATKSQHAPQMSQVAGVVGTSRNLTMSVTAASATATMTADEIIVESSLGGVRYCLSSFNKTINLATTGAGGMDTGTAPVSGFVALYAIYNPTTGTSALLATNATAAVQPQVYGGANMPSGYTASALVSVWPTNASSQFGAAYQIDRQLSFVSVSVLGASSTQQASPTSLSVANAVPRNARTANGVVSNASSTASALSNTIFSNAAQIGAQQMNIGSAPSIWSNWVVPIITSQTIFYSGTVGAGTMSLSIWVTGYTF